MRKKKNEIFNAIKEDITNNTKCYFLVVTIFIIGLFLGVFFVNQSENKNDIIKYLNTYMDEMKLIQNGDYFGELQNDVKNNITLVVLLWFAGTTIIGIPIVFGIILARSFCLGYTIASCVYALGKMKGIIFVIVTTFLQNIIFIPSIMILGVSSIKLYKSIIKDRRKENIKLSIAKHSMISVITGMALVIASIIKIGVSYRMMISLIKYF